MRILLLLIIISSYIFANAHIFLYHRFGDDRYPSTSTSLSELRKEFQYFKDNGYVVVKLEDIINKVKAKEEVPNNWVALTIDDSFKTFHKNGLPIFREFGYPFTMFVYIKATQDKFKDYMSWDELREVAKYGDLQLHTYEHPHLVSLSNDQIAQETSKSIELFQKEIGYKPKYYAYPFGEYDSRVASVIKSFGFEAVFMQSSGAINRDSDIYEIDRVPLVGGGVDLAQKLKLKALNAKFVEPIDYPKDGILRHIKAQVPKDLTSVQLYISEYGWRSVKVVDGIVDFELNKPLLQNKAKITILAKDNKISNKILIKGE